MSHRRGLCVPQGRGSCVPQGRGSWVPQVVHCGGLCIQVMGAPGDGRTRAVRPKSVRYEDSTSRGGPRAPLEGIIPIQGVGGEGFHWRHPPTHIHVQSRVYLRTQSLSLTHTHTLPPTTCMCILMHIHIHYPPHTHTHTHYPPWPGPGCCRAVAGGWWRLAGRWMSHGSAPGR